MKKLKIKQLEIDFDNDSDLNRELKIISERHQKLSDLDCIYNTCRNMLKYTIDSIEDKDEKINKLIECIEEIKSISYQDE